MAQQEIAPSTLRSNKWEHIALAGILALALALRLWGIGFGLPHRYHVDEATYVSQALNLGAGVIGRQPNPTGFSNLLFAEFGGYYVIGKVLGAFPSISAFEQAYRADPSALFFIGRVTSATFGVICVLVCFAIGRAMHGRTTAYASAALLSASFVHVRDSHFAVPDMTAVTCVTLTILFCVTALRSPRGIYKNLAFLMGGVSVATKWSTWPISLPLILLFISSLCLGNAEAKAKRHIFRKALCLFAFFAIGTALGGFQLFLNPQRYFEYALLEWRAGQFGGFGFWQIDTVSGWLFYAKTAWWGMGSVICCVGFLGMACFLWEGIRQRSGVHAVTVVFPLVYLVLMGSTRHYFARYFLPMVPFLCFFAAWFTVTLLQRLRNPAVRRTAMVAASVAMLAQPVVNSARFGWLLTQTDTRTIAKVWIEEHLPENARIALDWPTHGPPLSTLEQPAPHSARTYDVTIVGGTGLADHPVEWYRENGFDYVITSSFISEIPLVFPERNAQRQGFYASLDREFRLIQEFNPGIGGRSPRFIFDEIYGPAVSLWQRERPGPVLRIYEVQ
jgi:hypothetical protein